MTVQIILHDNTTVTAEITNYDAATLAEKMNDPKLLMIAVGNVIINKQSVKLIAPVPTQQ